MIKVLTGIEYTAQDFRKLKQCIRCGKAENIVRKNEMCNECNEKNVPCCDMCDILLHNGPTNFYTYDIKEDFREDGTVFKASKKFVREFIYTENIYNPTNPESLCHSCVDWRTRMKNKCFDCGLRFENTKKHYKLHGNLCGGCAKKYDKYVEKTRDDKPIGKSVRYRTYSNKGVSGAMPQRYDRDEADDFGRWSCYVPD